MPRRPRDWAPWALAISAVLAFDAALVAADRDSMSTRAARHPAVTITLLVALGCHLLGRPQALTPIDPLRAAGNAIRRHHGLA